MPHGTRGSGSRKIRRFQQHRSAMRTTIRPSGNQLEAIRTGLQIRILRRKQMSASRTLQRLTRHFRFHLVGTSAKRTPYDHFAHFSLSSFRFLRSFSRIRDAPVSVFFSQRILFFSQGTPLLIFIITHPFPFFNQKPKKKNIKRRESPPSRAVRLRSKTRTSLTKRRNLFHPDGHRKPSVPDSARAPPA